MNTTPKLSDKPVACAVCPARWATVAESMGHEHFNGSAELAVGDEVRYTYNGATGVVEQVAKYRDSLFVNWYEEQAEGVTRPVNGWYMSQRLELVTQVEKSPATMLELIETWRRFAAAEGDKTIITPQTVFGVCADALEAALDAQSVANQKAEEWTSHLPIADLVAGDDRQDLTSEQLRAAQDAHEANREI